MLDNFSKDGALEEQYLFGGVSVDLFSWLVECVKRKLVVDKVSERPDRASAMIQLMRLILGLKICLNALKLVMVFANPNRTSSAEYSSSAY